MSAVVDLSPLHQKKFSFIDTRPAAHFASWLISTREFEEALIPESRQSKAVCATGQRDRRRDFATLRDRALTLTFHVDLRLDQKSFCAERHKDAA